MSGADVKALAPAAGAPVFLDRAAIIGADDRSYVEVDCPELGGVVRVASMSGEARARVEALTARARAGEFVSGAELECFMVAQCAVDAEGRRLFSDDDGRALMAKNGAVISRLAKAAADVSGVPLAGDDGEAPPDATEVAAGN